VTAAYKTEFNSDGTIDYAVRIAVHEQKSAPQVKPLQLNWAELRQSQNS
jgi:hypothetical protein